MHSKRPSENFSDGLLRVSGNGRSRTDKVKGRHSTNTATRNKNSGIVIPPTSQPAVRWRFTVTPKPPYDAVYRIPDAADERPSE
ncbi:hypothetical protein [Neisseria sp.]|uniref:hypothetical protein n=1 Tax=Neisseria sp. TaxID=192066 RepID=UPI0035A1182F